MMRYNVRPDGRASIAPMMPFHNMSDEDMIAIISFLRSQPPVRHQVPDNEWTIAGKIIRMKTWFRTPNITPQKGSALMKCPDRATFVARFKAGGRQHAGTPMPWEAFASMSADDVGAVYEYLRSLPPRRWGDGRIHFSKDGLGVRVAFEQVPAAPVEGQAGGGGR